MNRKEMLARLAKGEVPLEVTILKWVDIENGEGKNLGPRNCALCETSGPLCLGCVVFEATKRVLCFGTPYRDYCDATTAQDRHEASTRERVFLESLRKKETEKSGLPCLEAQRNDP